MDTKTMDTKTNEYYFGDIKEYSLEEIENEVLNTTYNSTYLDVFAGSDLRFKKNITPIEDPLKLIGALEGVTYDYRTDDYPQYGFSKQKQMGFIAQEAQKVLPHTVKTNEEGYLGIDYSKFAPLLVEAIKALNEKVATLERDNNFLKERLSTLKRPSRVKKETEV